jgi:hypothetical protein
MDNLLTLVSSIERGLAEHYDDFSEDELHEINNTLSEAAGILGSRNQEQVTPPRGSEILWLLAGENPRAFQAYLRSFPNQSLNEFAQNPSRVQNLIQGFQSRITTPQGESAGGVPKSDLQSSNIYGFQYDPRSSTLRVRFQGGGLYEYDGVPPFVFKMFQRGAVPAKTTGQNQYGAWWQGKQPSLGASFHELIRDNFPYQRVA